MSINKEFVSWMQKRVANGSVGPSTIRGMAQAGTGEIIKGYLRALDINLMKASTESGFIKNLDAVTDRLLDELPRGSQNWGMVRKCVNIFLRHCVYNKYLCEHYKLGPLEKWLEIPLDSHVGKGLIAHSGSAGLPKWKKVITLTREESDQYQHAAYVLAKKKCVCRVHLDDWLYRGEHVIQKSRQIKF